jgi:iron complex outermembrane receptor protein
MISGQDTMHPAIDTVMVSQQPLYQGQDIGMEETNSPVSSLRREGNVFIRNYGPGSISTLSLRGGSAQQSLLLWHDVPMNHPMLGLADLSLLPNFSQPFELVQGSGSNLWGSGAVGGVLRMGQPLDGLNTTSLDLTFGSFSTLRGRFETQYGAENWTAATRGSVLHSQNDFPFQRSESGPSEKLKHGRFIQGHFQQDLEVKFSPQRRLSFHSWLFRGQRQIPPTLTQNESQAEQMDYGARMAVKYEDISDRHVFRSTLAYFRDGILYQDPSLGQRTESLGQSFNGSLSYSQTLGQHLFFASMSGQWIKGEISNYQRSQGEWRHHVNANYQIQIDQIRLRAGMGLSFRVDQWTPILPEVHIDLPLSAQSAIQVTVARHFRFPALNDLYWAPGGNPGLHPEEGWSQNVAYRTSWSHSPWKMIFSSELYHRIIDDFILWTIPQPGAFWAASNATQVRTLGGEVSISPHYRLPHGDLIMQFKYQYNRSRYTEDVVQPALESGSRLLLTPDHIGIMSLAYAGDEWGLEYQHEYTGTNRGINEEIDAFNLGHVRFQLQLDSNIQAHLSVNNIWDAAYMLTERRPMPGRYFEVGIHIKK